MMYLLIIYFMMNLVILMFLLSLYLLLYKYIIFMEYEFFKILSMKFEFVFYLDWISLMFIMLVMIISINVVIYSLEYMLGDMSVKRFMLLVFMFIMFMLLMIISPNMISILLGWDGLGLISYCLVIYYQNENSFNSGMVTVLMNRMGDVFLMMMIGLMVMLGSWNFMFFEHLESLMLLIIIIISATKSAQIPFSSWLPKAMAAPTPVSSLVHSSTLVTAGVYLMIRFNYLIFKNINLMKFLLFISLMTMFMAGVLASMEFDLKKIIALSTLSQLGVMMFSLSLGMVEVSFFHLVTHAMFKCMLFMCAGIFIHNMMLNQDIRYMNMLYWNMPIVSMIFVCSSFSLCGMPFLSGFFSKDKILEMFLMYEVNFMIYMILFISMGLTMGYSMRLFYYLMIKNSSMNIYIKIKSNLSLMIYSMLMLYIFTVILGFLLSWLIFSMKNVIYLSLKFKLIIYMFMMLGIFLSLFLSKFFMNKLFLKKIISLINMQYYMWFLSMLYKFEVYNYYKMSMNFSMMEYKWNEFMFGKLFYIYLKKVFKFDIFNKMYLLILMLIYYLIMMILFM